MRHIMTTTVRPISILFLTRTRRLVAQPALGFNAPFLPRPARSASAQPSSERSGDRPSRSTIDSRSLPRAPGRRLRRPLARFLHSA
jgi:hypothetical protein